MLLEIYKVHAQLAEQASESREGLNKLYTGMVSAIIAASVLIQRVAPGAETIWVLPVLGIVVSVCWLMSLRSMTGRLSAKHTVLVELEGKLPFKFFEREDQEYKKGRFVRRKSSGAAMPVLFLVTCATWLVASSGVLAGDGDEAVEVGECAIGSSSADPRQLSVLQGGSSREVLAGALAYYGRSLKA